MPEQSFSVDDEDAFPEVGVPFEAPFSYSQFGNSVNFFLVFRKKNYFYIDTKQTRNGSG